MRHAPKMRRYAAKLPFWAREDSPVWYQPSTGSRFAAVIDGHPWFAVGSQTWFARLRDVETAAGSVKVAAEPVSNLMPRLEAPCE